VSLKHALLGVLAARPMSGYELSQFFDSSTGWVWSAPHSQIYPLLAKMQADGVVVVENQIRGRRLNRKVYSLTPSGLDELTEWIGSIHLPGPSRDSMLVQALLFDMIDADLAVAVLEDFKSRQETIARDSRAHAARLAAHDTPLLRERLKSRPPEQHERIAALKAHVFEGQAQVAETRLRWAEKGIQILRAKL
jgi:DNA-binding PadR family transcriptional regulator